MTTTAALVKTIRRLLQDEPVSDYLVGDIAASDQSMVVGDISKHAVGTWWEFDDDTGDKVLETSVDAGTSEVAIRRSYRGSTPADHGDEGVLARTPRFEYDTVSQFIQTTLDADLYGEGLFDLVEHQILSDATTTYYNAPTTDCQQFLDVYQLTSDMTSPHRERLWFTPLPTNADTTLYFSGKYFVIQGNYGEPPEPYYVTCAHKLAIGTLNPAEERIVQWLTAAYLLEAAEIKRSAGPTNQGDQTVRPGANIPTAAYYRQLAEELIAKARRDLENQFPPKRRFVRA